MTIYLDYIFIEKFIIDYILIKETSFIARKKINTKNILLATTLTSLYIVCMIYFKLQQLSYLICKLLLIIVIVYICFKPKEIQEYIKLISIYFLINTINVGVLVSLKNTLNLSSITFPLKLCLYLLSFLIAKYFIAYMWTMYKREIKQKDLFYKVTLNIGEKKYDYNAFLDTGNNVFSYTHNVPVIFAEIPDKSIIKDLDKKQNFVINTVTLASNKEKRAYILDNVEISKNNEKWKVKVAIVFEHTKFSKEYNMLLNYILYTNDLGGIKI